MSPLMPPTTRQPQILAEGARQRSALSHVVGGLPTLPPAARAGGTRADAAGDRLERLHGVGAGFGVAGSVRARWRLRHAFAGVDRRQPRDIPLYLPARHRPRYHRAGPVEDLATAAAGRVPAYRGVLHWLVYGVLLRE